MKFPNILLLTVLLFSVHTLSAQNANILGSWQLIQQSSCVEEVANNQQGYTSTDDLRAEMRARTSASPQVVSFKANSTGEESTRILNSSRVANPKKFHYKFNGGLLLILDKKSQTISDSYTVDKCTRDSLILSSSSRPCEVRIFARIGE